MTQRPRSRGRRPGTGGRARGRTPRRRPLEDPPLLMVAGEDEGCHEGQKREDARRPCSRSGSRRRRAPGARSVSGPAYRGPGCTPPSSAAGSPPPRSARAGRSSTRRPGRRLSPAIEPSQRLTGRPCSSTGGRSPPVARGRLRDLGRPGHGLTSPPTPDPRPRRRSPGEPRDHRPDRHPRWCPIPYGYGHDARPH
jgi:hypothetical protein